MPGSNPAPDGESLTADQLAARWQVTTDRLKKWRQRGTGPHYFRLGCAPGETTGEVRYLLEVVKTWEHNGLGPTGQPIPATQEPTAPGRTGE